MSNDCSTGIVLEWYKGNSRTYRFTVLEKGTTNPINITDWPIAAEVWDAGTGQVKKSTTNITGGADDQIKIIDGDAGIFEVYFLKGETLDFEQDGAFEVTEYNDGGENTLYRVALKFLKPKINWVVIP